MKYLAMTLLLIGFVSAAPAFAQDTAAAETQTEQVAPKSDPTYEERMVLAKKMHELRPVQEQVEDAINRFAETRPVEERESFKVAMRNVLNTKALEKISVDAYTATFTLPELKSMVEYYSKPEARTASDKFPQYASIVYPEIMRMLDRAMMRVKTGE